MENTPGASADDIKRLLVTSQAGSRRKRIVLWSTLILLLAASAIAVYLYSINRNGNIHYTTSSVTRGSFAVLVTATGTLQPVNQVEVGTESSGTVRSVSADFNDTVRAGQVLAQLDTDQLNARLRQSLAALETAKASVTEAETTLKETHGKLLRAQELAKRGLCSQEDCDAAQATYERAQATLVRAQAQVSQAQAQVDADRTALGKAVIRSPINGIVLKRQIEPGQTVAASFQTPVLFVLAENLTQMELKVAVDEADVGKVAAGQSAVFSVDAYANREFPATISQVRFAPETVEGVVTYETVLSVDNSDLALRPGMTATANITVQAINDALLIPNAALRFTPPQPAQASTRGGSLISQLFPRPPQRSSTRPAENANGGQRQVWVLRDGQPVAIPITTGATNGAVTQVLDGALQAGMEVIVDSQSSTR